MHAWLFVGPSGAGGRTAARAFAAELFAAGADEEAAARHRRLAVAGAGLLGVSLSQQPASPRFYGLTLGVAATWLAGGVASGPLHLGWMKSPADTLRRPVLTPVATGVGAFGVFYAVALVVRKVPVIGPAITRVLRYAHQGSKPLVLTTTLANGIAEEVFFRGALYAAVGADNPVLKSTAPWLRHRPDLGACVRRTEGCRSGQRPQCRRRSAAGQ